MLEFLNMDGYGIFIWPSYIFAFSLIYYLYFRSLKQLKKLEKEIQALNRKLQRRNQNRKKLMSNCLKNLKSILKAATITIPMLSLLIFLSELF